MSPVPDPPLKYLPRLSGPSRAALESVRWGGLVALVNEVSANNPRSSVPATCGYRVGQFSSQGCEPTAGGGAWGRQEGLGDREGLAQALVGEVGGGGGQTEGRLSPLPLHPAPHPAAGSGGPKAGPLCWSPGDHIWDLVVVYCSPQSAAGQRSDSESDRPGFDPSCFALLRPQLTPGRAKRLPSLGASLASPGTRGRAPVSW